MSFILDALKKSEAERQRQVGPTLLEVRITRPRRRYPLWAVIVGALLGVNAVILVVFVLHRPAPSRAERTADVPATTGDNGARMAPPAPSPGPLRVAKSPAGMAVPGVARDAVIPGAPVEPAAATTAAYAEGGIQAGTQAGATTSPATAIPGAAGAGTVRSSATAAPPTAVAPLADSDSRNPADDEPALPPGSVQMQRAGPDNYANLPSISELDGKVPALQLDLLDYSDRPSERYALINMHRVREGDTLPEGPRVLAITRDGVALDYQGQDFLLRPGGSAQ